MTNKSFYSEKKNSETVITSYKNYGGGEYINYLHRKVTLEIYEDVLKLWQQVEKWVFVY